MWKDFVKFIIDKIKGGFHNENKHSLFKYEKYNWGDSSGMKLASQIRRNNIID
jgi:hypothetical protein